MRLFERAVFKVTSTSISLIAEDKELEHFIIKWWED